MIQRAMTSVLNETVKHYPIVLLTGPRQIGKSTLLTNLFAGKGYTYVSLDDSLELATAKEDPRSFLAIHPAPLMIDEAQKAPELFPELERIVNASRISKGNRMTNGLYILSGSQRSKLLDEAKESLAGRVAILDMSDLSQSEIRGRENQPFAVDLVTANQRALNQSIDENALSKQIVRGFFPVLYDDPAMDHRLFYSSYLTTYLEKDLKEEVQVRNELDFVRFMKILASSTGQELIYASLAKEVGVTTHTIISWVSALRRTRIIYLVEPYNEKSIVKRVIKRPKIYFFDTGFAAYLCGIDSGETLQNSFLKGRFFETFVFNEIRKSFMNAGILEDLYYYRDTEQNEVDMILVREGTLSCIEMKAGRNFNVSTTEAFRNLDKTRLKRGKDAIICTTDKVSILPNGTYLIPYTAI